MKASESATKSGGFCSLAAALICAVTAATGLNATSTPDFGGLMTDYGYADLADMAIAAPVTLAATILKATPLKGEAAAGVPAGRTRYFIEAKVDALVAGRTELPPTIRYLADLPTMRKAPKLKGMPVMLLGQTGPRPGEFRLIGPRGQVPRTNGNETQLRGILTASVAPDAPPAITGFGHAFHVPGSLPGESETQIFLKTQDNRPISLSILRRPGETPRWAVALSELTDASAAPPRPNSFLWYRLACGLPATLPPEATENLSGDDAKAAADDYRVVMTGLGPCHPAQKEASSTPTPTQSG